MRAEKCNFLKRDENMGKTKNKGIIKGLMASLIGAIVLMGIFVMMPTVTAAPGDFNINTPINDAYVSGFVNISWGQATGATNYTVLIDDVDPGSDISQQNDVTQNWTIWNSSSVSEGVRYINVTANNATGSTYALNNNISVNVDNTAPTVAIAYNISRTYYKDADSVRVFANFTETGSGIDESSVKITIVNSSGTTLNNSLAMTKTSNTNWYFDWHVPASNDGNVNVSIEATDNMSFSLSGTNWSLDKYIDNILPTSEVTIISTYWQNSAPLTIQATGSDSDSGLSSVTLYYYNGSDNSTWTGPWTFGVDSDPWVSISWSFNFSNGSSSHYRFYSIATDNASNVESEPTTNDTMCFYNNTPPNALGNPTPSNGTTYSTGSRPSSLSWTGGDIDNDAVNYTIYLKAGSSSFTSSDIAGYTENTTSYSVSLSWSTTYYWKIVATDEHGANALGPVWYFSTGAQSSGGGWIPPSEEEEEEEEGEPSEETIEYIEEQYNVTLEEKFYANDTDGDGVLDTLTDPNGVLTTVNFVNISGNASFLLSINDDEIPEFFWDANADTVTTVNHELGTVVDTEIDTEEETITISVDVNKSDWIYIEIIDRYPPNQYLDYTLVVKNESGENISSDMIWRENGMIYVLDDPDTLYEFVYGYTVLDPTFNPASGEIFDITRPTIAITYQEQVEITTATFGTLDITDQLTTTDNLTFTFTPKSDLVDGTYILSITFQDTDGNSLTSTATYNVQVIEEEPTEEEFPWLIIVIIAIIAVIFIALFRTKIFIH